MAMGAWYPGPIRGGHRSHTAASCGDRSREGRRRAPPTLLVKQAAMRSSRALAPVHRSAWKGCSRNFALRGFCELRMTCSKKFRSLLVVQPDIFASAVQDCPRKGSNHRWQVGAGFARHSKSNPTEDPDSCAPLRFWSSRSPRDQTRVLFGRHQAAGPAFLAPIAVKQHPRPAVPMSRMSLLGVWVTASVGGSFVGPIPVRSRASRRCR
jgi:hypothetical protein